MGTGLYVEGLDASGRWVHLHSEAMAWDNDPWEATSLRSELLGLSRAIVWLQAFERCEFRVYPEGGQGGMR